jgi:hypothetical protein
LRHHDVARESKIGRVGNRYTSGNFSGEHNVFGPAAERGERANPLATMRLVRSLNDCRCREKRD